MKDIHELTRELLEERGTENFHLALADLDPEDARKVVDSLTVQEIYIKVNHRTYEEDYIADYIDYLWDISRKAFWRHVYTVLDKNKGILWGGDMIYFDKMCDNEVPKKILYKFLDLVADEEYKLSVHYNLDKGAISCVLRSQKKKFGRWNTIKKYVKANFENHKDLLIEIKLLTKTKCSYHFGD